MNTRLGRAANLLVTLSDTHEDDLVAAELVLPVEQLERYRSGADAVPLLQQLCIALFLIERVPALARQGRTLLAQVVAQAAFESAETQVHNEPPLATHASSPGFRRSAPKHLWQ